MNIAVSKSATKIRLPKVLRLYLTDDDVRQEILTMMAAGRISRVDQLYNNALTLRSWAMDQRRNGYEIAAYQEEEHKFKILTMPILEAAAIAKED